MPAVLLAARCRLKINTWRAAVDNKRNKMPPNGLLSCELPSYSIQFHSPFMRSLALAGKAQSLHPCRLAMTTTPKVQYSTLILQGRIHTPKLRLPELWFLPSSAFYCLICVSLQHNGILRAAACAAARPGSLADKARLSGSRQDDLVMRSAAAALR